MSFNAAKQQLLLYFNAENSFTSVSFNVAVFLQTLLFAFYAANLYCFYSLLIIFNVYYLNNETLTK